ncbi:NtaA/DmoA family FMN-dependent monooxygenase [Pseudonocardia dioxanivorans]|uniref:NtaA/DmoA family FMN-dependent monooxygenase n=1 Tax=Pseudonocardia dioxanivorans TaxID=240495 RepID=UPI000CD2DEC1|nr:NtaA/DmoA family FMN-dependent monooxygenase [Pseudonocardia dioxanivorans]
MPAPRELILAAMFPGDGNFVAWRHPDAGSQTDFASFAHFARTAERGLFDMLLMGESLGVVERDGQVLDHTVIGRPDLWTLMPGLAAVTERVGLAATRSARFNEPWELARQFATLDHLSGGRAGWNVVTSLGQKAENFRSGYSVSYADRYAQASEFIAVSRRLWTTAATEGTGRARLDHDGEFFSVHADFAVPVGPQVVPPIIQAGGSTEGRDFGAAVADVIFTDHQGIGSAQAFHADVRRRAAAVGRDPATIRVITGVSFVVADSDAEAREKAAWYEDLLTSPRVAIDLLEQLWGRDLSTYDPDGPLPEIEPDWEAAYRYTSRRAVGERDARTEVARYRALAEEHGLTIRQVIAKVGTRFAFTGSPGAIADEMTRWFTGRAADGFVITPKLLPYGLDEFVDHIVPELQERGVFRTAYTGSTLRDHLGLASVSLPAAAGR